MTFGVKTWARGVWFWPYEGTHRGMTTTEIVPTSNRSNPLMQFGGRVGESNACVRIQRRRLEWSMVGSQWVIQMAPMSSITAVTTGTGAASSSLFVTTTVGTVEFMLQPEIAEDAVELLGRLIVEAAGDSTGVNQGSPAGDLINLRWTFDDQPMSLLGS